jgi:hypothetical protein
MTQQHQVSSISISLKTFKFRDCKAEEKAQHCLKEGSIIDSKDLWNDFNFWQALTNIECLKMESNNKYSKLYPGYKIFVSSRILESECIKIDFHGPLYGIVPSASLILISVNGDLMVPYSCRYKTVKLHEGFKERINIKDMTNDQKCPTLCTSVSYDPSFARTSSGQSPDDAGFARIKAHTSWLCHDPSFARTSSGLRPDDLQPDQSFIKTDINKILNIQKPDISSLPIFFWKQIGRGNEATIIFLKFSKVDLGNNFSCFGDDFLGDYYCYTISKIMYLAK